VKFPFPAIPSAFRERRAVRQPIPDVLATDVERIVRRDFPDGQFDAVMGVLKQYGAEKWQRERARVQLAALKLADRDLDKLQRVIEVASRDYRDVLAPAEYPEYRRRTSSGLKMAEKERDRAIDSDWEQYQAWLKR
jgi:hypothetical protein